jgi:DNA-binding MarR family transcriptional regulator
MNAMKIEAFLQESPLFEITWAARRFESHLTAQLSDEKVNFLEALILISLVVEKPFTVSPSRLAETFATSRGNVSHCVSSLEARGLMGRVINPQDARAYRLSIKPPGKKLAMQLIRNLDRMQKYFEKAIGMNELKAALQVIRRVEQACSEMSRPGQMRR